MDFNERTGKVQGGGTGALRYGDRQPVVRQRALVDTNHMDVVEYRYDAWGKLLATTGSMAATLGKLNPFRYRGYIYDEETGLYWLRSRYNNPEWKRFVNADSVLGKCGELISHNLFVYCGNNPFMQIDPSGNVPVALHQIHLLSIHVNTRRKSR